MNQKTCLLFDLDGTLTDPELGITHSVMYALQRFGIEVADRRTLYPFIGPPLLESFEAYAGLSPSDAQKAVAYYREYFSDRGLFENQVYDGIEPLLRALRAAGRRLLVATSKPTVFAARILEHFGLSGYFEQVVGSHLDGTRVEKAEVIAHALECAGRPNPAAAVMIGDRRFDAEGARAAGIACVGVLYGYGSRKELEQAGADRLCATVEELRRCLLGG